jgi:hypothetical protein
MNAAPVLLPELVAVALPPFTVCAKKPPVLLPELVAVALPPPLVSDVKPTAVPEFVVVALALAFWAARYWGKKRQRCRNSCRYCQLPSSCT